MEDPDLVLVKIQVTQAEIWDSGLSKTMDFAKILNAIMMQEEYKDENEHIVITL